MVLDADHSLDFLGTQEATGNAGGFLSCFTACLARFLPFQTKVALLFFLRSNKNAVAHVLTDPCNRNHKSLAIGNHNFEVASFSRRIRSKIAVSQSQK